MMEDTEFFMLVPHLKLLRELNRKVEPSMSTYTDLINHIEAKLQEASTELTEKLNSLETGQLSAADVEKLESAKGIADGLASIVSEGPTPEPEEPAEEPAPAPEEPNTETPNFG